MSISENDKKWLNNEFSKEERKDFEKTDEYQFLNKLQQSLENFKAQDYDVTEGEKQLEENFGGKSIHIGSWATYLKIAASVVLILSAYFIYQTYDTSDPAPLSVYSTKKSSLYLPDSSYVALNARTTLSYNWAESRGVNLSGEAFFKVKTGSQFKVVTDFGTVSVLGTQFNVEAWDDFFEVTCYEGTVKIKADTKEIVLNKHESYQLISDDRSLSTTSDNTPDWQDGESRFQSIPLKYVLKELERQYDVTIAISGVDLKQQFTGAFPHDNINLALKSISVPLALSYRLEENQVQITTDQ